MKIDDKLIAYLEDLSCLTLSAEEKIRLAKELENILVYMTKLGGLDTQGVPERSHPFDITNVFREDEVQPSMPRELILKNAAEQNGECFVAPKTVE